MLTKSPVLSVFRDLKQSRVYFKKGLLLSPFHKASLEITKILNNPEI